MTIPDDDAFEQHKKYRRQIRPLTGFNRELRHDAAFFRAHDCQLQDTEALVNKRPKGSLVSAFQIFEAYEKLIETIVAMSMVTLEKNTRAAIIEEMKVAAEGLHIGHDLFRLLRENGVTPLLLRALLDDFQTYYAELDAQHRSHEGLHNPRDGISPPSPP